MEKRFVVEQYAIELEEDKRKEEIKKEIRKRSAVYREKIEQFLGQEAYGELLEYFQTEDIKAFYQIETDIAILHLMLLIYQEELTENIKEGILSGIHSIREARERYLKAKFLMWRLEFLGAKDGLPQFLQQEWISVVFLRYLIHASSFRKADTAFRMALTLKESGRLANAFAMLNYANELSPDEEIVFCEMADICILTGQLEHAKECLGRIRKPSDILAWYQKKWGLSDE